MTQKPWKFPSNVSITPINKRRTGENASQLESGITKKPQNATSFFFDEFSCFCNRVAMSLCPKIMEQIGKALGLTDNSSLQSASNVSIKNLTSEFRNSWKIWWLYKSPQSMNRACWRIDWLISRRLIYLGMDWLISNSTLKEKREKACLVR